tara:strand:+ start:235 stop:1074 length:840 start_codon:yes stop_codon:yes gene_type:complete
MADTILSLLEPGEYVLNRNAVDKLGKKTLDEINYEEAPRFPNKYQVGGDVNSNKSILGDYFNQQLIPSYANGGTVSYGGYESEEPTLTNLYEMFGVQPNKENEKRFQPYDPSREGVYKQDYETALDKSQRTAEEGMEQLYGATAGAGGFSGSGAVDTARTKGRKSLMGDYLSSEKTLGSTMFKGVRSERETWLKETGSQLRALEELDGTDKYTPPGVTPPQFSVPFDDPDWAPEIDVSKGDPYKFKGTTYYWSGTNWETEATMEAEDYQDSQDRWDYGP